MVKHALILFILVFTLTNVFAQPQGKHVVNVRIHDGDTVPFIQLREVIILPPRTFKNQNEANRYRKLVRRIKKTLPYAKIAGAKLRIIEAKLDSLPNDRARRKFIDEVDKQLKAEFEGQLRQFSIKDGIMLIKLIDRETGDTSYELIKELKGSVTAFMWQTVARMFGSNLKLEYEPEGTDKLIEEICIRIENGSL